jgi:hypothetical protein
MLSVSRPYSVYERLINDCGTVCEMGIPYSAKISYPVREIKRFRAKLIIELRASTNIDVVYTRQKQIYYRVTAYFTTRLNVSHKENIKESITFIMFVNFHMMCEI